MRLGSQRQLARELGCAPNHINELCKKNDYRIIKVGKKINLDESIAALVAAGFGSKTKKKLAPKKTKPKKQEPEDNSVPEKETLDQEVLPELTDGLDRPELERRKIYEQARKEKLNNDEKDRILVNRRETENKWFEIARTVRDALETIPGNVSGLLVGKTKHEIEQELIKHIKRTLFNLKDEIK